MPGAWRAQTPDGTWVTYRPAGQASDKTLPSTASVDINSSQVKGINNNRELKLKFPTQGNSAVGGN
jgi:filamentous hemagglutinin